MNKLPVALLQSSINTIPKQHIAEFWQEIAYVNIRRVRVMVIFAIAACLGLLYVINVVNILHLSAESNRIVLIMHGILLLTVLVFGACIVVRPVRTAHDISAYHYALLRAMVPTIIIAPQTLIHAIIITEGHPIFFFLAVLLWYSSLLTPPHISVIVFGGVLAGYWLQMILFTPSVASPFTSPFAASHPLPANSSGGQFGGEAVVFSVLVPFALFLSGTFLFRSTVEAFRQRKAVEEERNRVAELHEELQTAYVETDAMNQELRQKQEILEEQAVEIEIFNTQLHEQNEVLLALNEEKNEILGIVSHDLKNPIAAVRGLAEILQTENVGTDEASEIVHHITVNAERMLDLVGNLLDMNRLESGVWTFQATAVDMVDILASIVKEYHITAKAKNIHLHYSSEQPSLIILADEQALMQVLDNLVSNAVKYSPQGKNVVIRLKSITNVIRVEIQDEGPGISSEDMKKLFGKFARLSARPTGGEHSTGLGLSIVKKMVEAMNGNVWCESELGKGATFIVELPMIR
ncbi:MAG: HAMP domain-containing histidine kinase [Candidatus Kapabacteria bacterium]|jgi:signal transduction histidine kinase|nr:HAMP domain-containing histidine kinase [Candidatus Kapabacteria bacterium]